MGKKKENKALRSARGKSNVGGGSTELGRKKTINVGGKGLP